MKKIIKWIVIIVVVLFLIGLIFGADDAKNPPAQPAVSNETVTDPMVAETGVVAEPEVVAKDDGMTNQQKNAVRSAKNYIGFQGFSRDGLINQLSSDAGDGYNIDDATIAVDSLDIDYNEQAGRSAENYISIMGFSCDGLVEQLSSSAGDKYTKEQAEYGAKLAGACD
ncbi:Ltp family lipoprotein [Psychrobacter glaciei]|uniref:Ltp family lipoprotein n=1 Tax=Psychrobacter glaciei TaxID=619771 RepID=UPI001F05ED19|nr:Ltp family lipoprotein [Psychrobacter glaciei]MCH1781739.1 Ltp family lipoprotein [Psychrobacter glaciei]